MKNKTFCYFDQTILQAFQNYNAVWVCYETETIQQFGSNFFKLHLAQKKTYAFLKYICQNRLRERNSRRGNGGPFQISKRF